MLYKKFTRLTFLKNMHTLGYIFAILGLLSESMLSGFGQETASEKSPFCNLLSELIYLKLKRYGWRQVNHGNRLQLYVTSQSVTLHTHF